MKNTGSAKGSSTQQQKTKVTAAQSVEKNSHTEKRQRSDIYFELINGKKTLVNRWMKKQYLIDRDGNKCMYCGITMKSPTIEHIKPLSKGGTNKDENLGLACEKCNTQEIGWRFIQLCRAYYQWKEITLWRA